MPIKRPAAIVQDGAVLQEVIAPVDIVYGEGDAAIKWPALIWDHWTPKDWATQCPAWTVLPLIDEAPTVSGKRAERLPMEQWDVGESVVIVNHRLVDLTPEEVAAQGAALKQAVADAVQRHLDTAAAPRNYTSAAAAVSYVGDPNAKWDAEGRAVRAWRSAVWTACFAALDDVLAGRREPLTPEQMIAELPALVWP